MPKKKLLIIEASKDMRKYLAELMPPITEYFDLVFAQADDAGLKKVSSNFDAIVIFDIAPHGTHLLPFLKKIASMKGMPVALYADDVNDAKILYKQVRRLITKIFKYSNIKSFTFLDDLKEIIEA